MSGWKANRLRVLRAERRWTQLTVARRVGTSQGTYSMWENALVEPSDTERAKLARVFDVPVDSLVPGEDQRAAS